MSCVFGNKKHKAQLRKLYAPRAFTWACEKRSNKKKTNRKKQTEKNK